MNKRKVKSCLNIIAKALEGLIADEEEQKRIDKEFEEAYEEEYRDIEDIRKEEGQSIQYAALKILNSAVMNCPIQSGSLKSSAKLIKENEETYTVQFGDGINIATGKQIDYASIVHDFNVTGECLFLLLACVEVADENESLWITFENDVGTNHMIEAHISTESINVIGRGNLVGVHKETFETKEVSLEIENKQEYVTLFKEKLSNNDIGTGFGTMVKLKL